MKKPAPKMNMPSEKNESAAVKKAELTAGKAPKSKAIPAFLNKSALKKGAK